MGEPFLLEGKPVAVVGLAQSGRAAAHLLLDRGGKVYASDVSADSGIQRVADEIRELGGVVEVGGHDVARIATAELVVVSPGIPPDAPVLRELRERGVSWISELELAFRFLACPLIAVTGTNGKTTTAALTAHLLRSGGEDAVLSGNVGESLGPALSEVARRSPPPDWVVAEASSFQLSATETFAPRIGVLTNLAPDHLDRYASVEAYYGDKARLFANARPSDSWILNGEDEEVMELAAGTPGRHLLFGEARPPSGHEGAFVGEETLFLRDATGGEDRLLPLDELPLLGAHNVLNALAAALAARAAGIPVEAVGRGLRSFQGLPHRLEIVAEAEGILWINDSKATNVASARAGIASMTRPAVVLLGGRAKEASFAGLLPALEDRARAVVALGEARRRIVEELSPHLPVEEVEGDLADAVRVARRLARPGDAILLSPACASFDMFASYEERGRRFGALVRSHAGGAASRGAEEDS